MQIYSVKKLQKKKLHTIVAWVNSRCPMHATWVNSR